MAALADGIDFFLQNGFGRSSKVLGSSVDQTARTGIGMCYLVCSFTWLVVWGKFSNRDFSAILTAASCVQCLGFMILSVKVRATKSVSGLSSKTLVLFVLHFCTRLTSTTLKSGYLPVDKSGDFMYQAMDIISLLLVLHLLHSTHKTHAHSYQDEHDSLPLLPLVIPCVVLACFVHSNFNKNLFFDIIWALSTYLETVTLIPQLWMMASIGGKVDVMTAHFVAAIVISGVMTFTFWWWTFPQLGKKGPSIAGKLVLAAQVLKLFLNADFMYYYTQSWLGGSTMVLPSSEETLEM